MNSHYKDKTISWPSYLNDNNSDDNNCNDNSNNNNNNNNNNKNEETAFILKRAQLL